MGWIATFLWTAVAFVSCRLAYSTFVVPHEPAIRNWVKSRPNRLVDWVEFRIVKGMVLGRAHQALSQDVRLLLIIVIFLPIAFFINLVLASYDAELLEALGTPTEPPAIQAPVDKSEVSNELLWVRASRFGWMFGFVLWAILFSSWASYRRDAAFRFERHMDRLLRFLSPEEMRTLMIAEGRLLSDSSVRAYVALINTYCEEHGLNRPPTVWLEQPNDPTD